jgi:hypothetical protein
VSGGVAAHGGAEAPPPLPYHSPYRLPYCRLGSRGAGPRGAWERGGCAEREEGGGSWVSSAGEVYSNIFAQGRAKQCDARKGVAGREGARHLCRE